MIAARDLAADWRVVSACRGEDPALWFAEDDPLTTARARAICRACPVNGPCLEFALASNERHGIWGGYLAGERRRIKRDRRRRVGQDTLL